LKLTKVVKTPLGVSLWSLDMFGVLSGICLANPADT